MPQTKSESLIPQSRLDRPRLGLRRRKGSGAALDDPRAKQFSDKEFWDSSWVEEIRRSGFVEQPYKRREPQAQSFISHRAALSKHSDLERARQRGFADGQGIRIHHLRFYPRRKLFDQVRIVAVMHRNRDLRLELI